MQIKRDFPAPFTLHKLRMRTHAITGSTPHSGCLHLAHLNSTNKRHTRCTCWIAPPSPCNKRRVPKTQQPGRTQCHTAKEHQDPSAAPLHWLLAGSELKKSTTRHLAHTLGPWQLHALPCFQSRLIHVPITALPGGVPCMSIAPVIRPSEHTNHQCRATPTQPMCCSRPLQASYAVQNIQPARKLRACCTQLLTHSRADALNSRTQS